MLLRSLHSAWQLVGDALRMLDTSPGMNLDAGSERERRANSSSGAQGHDGEATGEGHDVSAESLLVRVMLQVCVFKVSFFLFLAY